MKNKILKLFSFLLIMISSLLAENNLTNDFYYYQGSRISLNVIPDQLSIVFKEEMSGARFTNILQKILGTAYKSADEKTGKRSRLIRLAGQYSKAELSELLQKLNKQSEIFSAAPVYYSGNASKRVTIDQDFIARFDEQISESEIEHFALQNNLVIRKKIAESTWLFTVNPSSGLNGLSAANKYHESEIIIWAQPDFIYMNWEILNASVNDTYWPQQWSHKNIGQSVATGATAEFPATVNGYDDADMDVDLAWDELVNNGGQAGGSASVLIATLDSGVDLDHPDLQGNLYSNGVDFTDDGQSDANDSQGHGTSVAGLIAAVADNGQGVAGIAYNSKILPLRIMNEWGVTETSNLVQAFDYAWQEGADVISNSWTSTTPENALTEAIQRAKTQGRGGLGCVILFSSGNKGAAPVEYPSDLDEVIAVGAANMFDEKKNNGSSDYVYKWSANYGSALDVVAPTINYTTDIQGSAGYAEGDYFEHFGGTSAACPNAAGVAALILAANSGLTSDQVQEVLENSADKIERYTYDINGWNKHVGHGRVNAYNAVRQAFGSDGSAPLMVHQWPASIRSIEPRTISVDISDDNGIATGAEQPALYYRTVFETSTSDWASVTDSDGPSGSTYEFTIPGQKWATQVQYYILAQDNSATGNSQTYPFGGSAAQAPETNFIYHVGNFETITYSSTDVPVTWENDWQTYHISILNISDTRRIVDLNVNINYSGNVSEVGIDLKGPDQLGSGLFMHYDGSALTNTKFDDEAATSISEGSSPYSGSFMPDNGLFVFDGKQANGQWTLGAYDGDWLNSNDGSITNWNVEIKHILPNASPVVSDIPGQTIDEGGSFADITLDNYVLDVDHPDDSLKWTYSGNQDLTVSINASRIAHISVPNQDWFGSEIITFTATDPGGYADSDTVLFTVNPVNDAPVVTDIEDQQIEEGGSFIDINLDNYVSDIDNSDAQMTWTAGGNVDLIVNINTETHVARITTPNENWNGSETITFTATDPGGLSANDPAVFTVTAVNDTPVVGDILDQTIDEGGSFTNIDLDDYVSDVDNTDAEMIWTSSGNVDLQVSINTETHVAQISVPAADWTGSETIWFKATDPGGRADSNAAVFTVNAVNDTPVVSDIPDQIIDEGGTFADIFLDEFVTDGNNSDEQMTWTYSGNQDLLVSINSETRIAHITAPDENWNGAESVWFKVTDPGGLADSNAAVFTVNAVNDTPQITSTPVTNATQGVAYEYQVTAEDVDADDVLRFSLMQSPAFLSIDSVSGLISGLPQNSDVGEHAVSVQVKDLAAATDDQSYQLTVDNENDSPVVTDIPDQTIDEGQLFDQLILDNYVDDPDNSPQDMQWTASGNNQLQVTINADRIATITAPDSNWYGSEQIIFTAQDPGGLSDSDSAVFTIRAVNDPPLISEIPGQEISEGGSFNDIHLDNFVQDADDADAALTWSAAGNVQLDVTIDANRVAHISVTDIEWNGSENIVFTVQDPAGLFDKDTALFTVLAVNDPPQFTPPLPVIIFNEDDSLLYAISNWYPYVSDADDADSTLSYSLEGGNDELSFAENGEAFLFKAGQDWFGQDSLTLIADDGFASDSAQLLVKVRAINDAPQIVNLPDSVVFKNTEAVKLQMSSYEQDIDSPALALVWGFSASDSALHMEYEAASKELTLSAPGFEGLIDLFMILEDDSGAIALDTLPVIIKKQDTAIRDFTGRIPLEHVLFQNYPNPFNPHTTIQFGLSKMAEVEIKVFDNLGREVSTLLQGRKASGYHQVIFDGTLYASGVYFYRIVIRGSKPFFQIRKMLLVK